MRVFNAVGDFFQRVQAILWVLTLLWLLVGGLVLGILYSFIVEYRDLPVPGQAFFAVAIFAGTGLCVLTGARLLWHAQLVSPKEAHAPNETEKLVAQLADSRREVDDERTQRWKRESEARSLKDMCDALINERDELKQRLASLEADSLEHLKERMRLGHELELLKPRTEWADSLIGRERDSPRRYLSVTAQITNASKLKEGSPCFDLIVSFSYSGVLHLTVASGCSGRLSWEGEKLSLAPEFTAGYGGALPIEGDGPMGGAVRIRVYVLPAHAERLWAYFFKTKNEEIDFDFKDITIPLVATGLGGEEILNGNLTPRTELAVGIPRRKRIIEEEGV